MRHVRLGGSKLPKVSILRNKIKNESNIADEISECALLGRWIASLCSINSLKKMVDEESLKPRGLEQLVDTSNESFESLLSNSNEEAPSDEDHQMNEFNEMEERLLRKLGVELKQLVADYLNNGHIDDENEDDNSLPSRTLNNNILNDRDQDVSLHTDTYSLMMISKPFSRPWVIGLGIYALQMTLLVFVCREMFFDCDFWFWVRFSSTPDPLLSCAQFLVLITIFFLQNDLVEVTRNLFVLNDDDILILVGAQNDNSYNKARRFVLPNLLKLTMAIITIVVTVVVTLQSKNMLELLKDFAALLIINEIDDRFFSVVVQNGLG